MAASAIGWEKAPPRPPPRGPRRRRRPPAAPAGWPRRCAARTRRRARRRSPARAPAGARSASPDRRSTPRPRSPAARRPRPARTSSTDRRPSGGDLQGLRLLRGVGVLRARVHLQLGELLPGEAVLGQHALDREADDLLGTPLEHVVERARLEAARVAGVAVVEGLSRLFFRPPEFLGG